MKINFLTDISGRVNPWPMQRNKKNGLGLKTCLTNASPFLYETSACNFSHAIYPAIQISSLVGQLKYDKATSSGSDPHFFLKRGSEKNIVHDPMGL